MRADDDQTARELIRVGQDSMQEAVTIVSERFPDAAPSWCVLVVLATAANMAGDDGVAWEDVTQLVQIAFTAGAGASALQ